MLTTVKRGQHVNTNKFHIYLNSKQDMHLNEMHADVSNTIIDILYNNITL